MTAMGINSKPDGIPAANGHAPVSALAPFAISPELQVRQGGPVVSWPQPAKPDRWRHVTSATRAISAHREWLAAIPVILVNAVAFAGQLAFLRTHLPWPLAGQALVAVTLESVAVYLAWQAHLALAADDSALRLRLAAYGFAAVIGIMNYTHWMAPGWRPTFAAVTFGLMSVSSPWLWSVHSRRASRDALKARGLIEPHAVRLGATRWTWHPLRSARVMFRATWQGVNDPAVAIALPAMKVPEVAADDMPASAPDDGCKDVGAEDENPDSEDDKTSPLPSAGDEKKDDKTSPLPPPPDTQKVRQGRPSARAKVAAIIKRHPDLTDAEVAKRAGVSVRTVQRARS